MKEKHGKTDSDEYRIWTDIKTRCSNKNHRAYKNYGGRGIEISIAWKNSFIQFFIDVGERPSKNHSIDRIDNDGNYEKSNCRWATSKEQGANKRNNRKITILGETKNMSEWADEKNISSSLIFHRINAGKTGESLIAPCDAGITFNGVTDTIKGWSERTGIKSSTIGMRLAKYKWSVEKTLTTKARVRKLCKS